MELSNIIAILSLICSIVRTVVSVVNARRDSKKQAATTANSDGLDAE